MHIVHAEVLPPGRKAMSLINDKADDVPGQQNLLYRLGPQHLRGDIEQRRLTIPDSFNGIGPVNRVQKPVNGDGIRNSASSQIVDLVFHQGLERGNNDREATYGTPCHKCRQLERQ